MNVQQMARGVHVPTQVSFSKTVLVVDPDVRSLDWIRRVLGSSGAWVVGLTSVDNATRYLADDLARPALLISGPGMSSSEQFQLIAFLRNRLQLSALELPAITFFAQDTERVPPHWLYMYQAHLSDKASDRQLLGTVSRLMVDHTL